MTNDNVCSQFFVLTDDNAYKHVIFVTPQGKRESQPVFTSNVEARAFGTTFIGKPIPQGAHPA